MLDNKTKQLAQDAVDIVFADLNERLSQARGPLVFGLAGAQGSGKSTIAEKLAARLEAEGARAAILSLDDLYFDRARRARLAKKVHPLLITRGAPGTHDARLGLKVMRAIRAGRRTLLPRFDKGTDSRKARSDWEKAPRQLDVAIFEGWCVGATPQKKSALKEPINELERLEDSRGVWRRYVNSALAGKYQSLFKLIDRFVYLRAPSFEIVKDWRIEQERELAASAPASRLTHLMSDAEIGRFIQHFERLTRHMMQETPARADLTLQLDERRRVIDAAWR